MGRLKEILNEADYSYEMSNKVVNKKRQLSEKLYDLFDEYFGVEAEAVEELTDNVEITIGDNIKIVYIAAEEYDACLEDENGNNYFFIEDLTLKEIKNVISKIKKIIKEDYL
jgi:hypothetical protein